MPQRWLDNKDKSLHMSNMVTRCPKCATSFRITSAQLQSAKGAVRCGSCLHIFKAQDHLLSGEAPAMTPPLVSRPGNAAESKMTPRPNQPSAPIKKPETGSAKPFASPQLAQPSPSEKPTPAPVNSTTDAKPSTDTLLFNQSEIDEEIAALGDDDDILISDDMGQSHQDAEGDGLDEFLNIDAKPPQSTSLFERNNRQVEHETSIDADESWAENLLDDAEDETQFDQLRRQITATENDHGNERNDPADDELFDYSDSVPPAYDATAKGPVFSLVDDDPDAENNFREIFTETELSEEIRAINRDEAHANSRETEVPMRAYDTSRAALLMNIMPEPVVMTSRRKRSWYQRKSWTLLSLLMIILLGLQLAWMQFDTLSRIQPYRAAYEFVCPTLGCSIPTLVDRTKIRVRNLLVRKHPDIADALMVDVIILNNAPFEQPFPDLVMAFSDIDERPVAARRFTPREYLAGELAGIKLMPQNQPVHISLELVDPGDAAVNYKIEPY